MESNGLVVLNCRVEEMEVKDKKRLKLKRELMGDDGGLWRLESRIKGTRKLTLRRLLCSPHADVPASFNAGLGSAEILRNLPL